MVKGRRLNSQQKEWFDFLLEKKNEEKYKSDWFSVEIVQR